MRFLPDDQIEYEVRFLYDEQTELSVIVIDEEGMNEKELILEAQVIMQKAGAKFDTEKLDLISCIMV